jgi:AraC-like DNA-binding protein
MADFQQKSYVGLYRDTIFLNRQGTKGVYDMSLYLDNPKIKELMEDFYTLTGIKIVIFDSDYLEILSYPEEHCGFCRLMHNDPKTRQHCLQSNKESFEHCKKSGELIVYQCHAGLIEATAPLIDNGVIIGYIMFGQITDIGDKEEFLERMRLVCKKYQIKLPDYGDTFSDIKLKSREEIRAAAKILEACTFYVLLKEMIYLEKEQFVRRMNMYIETHLSEEITVSDLCSEFQISRSKLYEVSEQYLGMGIAEYIKRKRMKAAKQYLKNTEKSVSEISEIVGFSDYNYFCRVFKKEVGIPAKKYRKIYCQDAVE